MDQDSISDSAAEVKDRFEGRKISGVFLELGA